MSQTLLLKVKGSSALDAIAEIDQFESDEDVRMYMDLGIPDEMLRSLHERHPLHNFIDSPLPGTMKLLFPRRGQTWRATLYDYYHSRKDRQLTVKLSHNGFRYHKRRYLQAGVSSHRRQDYFVLGDDVLVDMPFLSQLKKSLDAKIAFLYNVKHKRIDIKFYKADGDQPFLLITFEPGHPESDVGKEFRF